VKRCTQDENFSTSPKNSIAQNDRLRHNDLAAHSIRDCSALSAARGLPEKQFLC